MVYQVPPSQASLPQNRFEFTLPGDDRVWSVPLLQYLRPALAFAVADAGELAGARLIFDTYLPDALPLFEDTSQLEAFFTAWQEASGITAGESPASPGS